MIGLDVPAPEGVARQPGKDDRILAPTRWVAAAIVPVLTAAFVLLYLFPTRTTALWAWTIKAPLTAMVMGGGYLAGAYFFVRVATGRQWHRVGWAFVGIIAFATLLGVATFLHWSIFNHGHVSFWAWLSLYTVTPFLLPWLWVTNRRTDPGRPAPGEVLIAKPLRWLVGAAGLTQLAFALTMFVRPSAVMARWPWPLTPLTARTLSAFLAFPAFTWVCFLVDDRWSSFQVPIETTTIGLALVALAVAIRSDDLTSSGTGVAVYLTLLAAAVVGLVVLQLAMRRAAGRSGP